MQIAEGSIVCGKSGEPLRVISACDGKVVVKTDGRLIRVDQSLILRVISPPPEPIYEYIGSKWQQQYKGIPLKLVPDAIDQSMGDSYCFEKPDGYRTTWLKMSEVRQVNKNHLA